MNSLELHLNTIKSYLDKTHGIKKSTYLETINYLDINSNNLTLDQIAILFNYYLFITVKYKDKERSLFYEIVRKIIILNHNVQQIVTFCTINYLDLFCNDIIRNEDYMFFKLVFLEKINYDITNKFDRFKYFKEFLDIHYKINNLKENNILLSKIFVLRDCDYPIQYLEIINDLNLEYSLDFLLLTKPNNVILKEHMPTLNNSFKYKECLYTIESIIDKLIFVDINKLVLSKVLKYHGINIFTILLLINLIKKLKKLLLPDFEFIFDIIKDNKEDLTDFNDIYFKDFLEIAIKKKYYVPHINLLNLTAKYRLSESFKYLIDNEKIKPTPETLEIIVKNTNSHNIDNLKKMLEMKFILTNEHINYFLTNSMINSKLRELLTDNNYLEFNETIFENYIKYKNYLLNKNNKKGREISEKNILNSFILDKSQSYKYFEIIHNNNQNRNYDDLLDFIENNLKIKNKELKHFLEFSKIKYNNESNYKDLVEEYMIKAKFKINKFCVDNCMKTGNYNCGLYLIDKYNVIPDIYTLLFIKNLDERIDFTKKYKKLIEKN